jgi:hypothetical protein
MGDLGRESGLSQVDTDANNRNLAPNSIGAEFGKESTYLEGIETQIIRPSELAFERSGRSNRNCHTDKPGLGVVGIGAKYERHSE